MWLWCPAFSMFLPPSSSPFLFAPQPSYCIWIEEWSLVKGTVENPAWFQYRELCRILEDICLTVHEFKNCLNGIYNDDSLVARVKGNGAGQTRPWVEPQSNPAQTILETFCYTKPFIYSLSFYQSFTSVLFFNHLWIRVMVMPCVCVCVCTQSVRHYQYQWVLAVIIRAAYNIIL